VGHLLEGVSLQLARIVVVFVGEENTVGAPSTTPRFKLLIVSRPDLDRTANSTVR
jgi:hypothetical protein